MSRVDNSKRLCSKWRLAVRAALKNSHSFSTFPKPSHQPPSGGIKHYLPPAGRKPGDWRQLQRARSDIAPLSASFASDTRGEWTHVLDPSGERSKARGSKKKSAVRRNQKLPHACRANSPTICATPSGKERYRAAIRWFCQGEAEGVNLCSRPRLSPPTRPAGASEIAPLFLKHKVDGADHAQTGPEVVPAQWLFHIQRTERNEYRQSNHFL